MVALSITLPYPIILRREEFSAQAKETIESKKYDGAMSDDDAEADKYPHDDAEER
jgi:hypothetical protein